MISTTISQASATNYSARSDEELASLAQSGQIPAFDELVRIGAESGDLSSATFPTVPPMTRQKLLASLSQDRVHDNRPFLPGFSPLPAVSRSMKFAEGTVKRKFLSRTTRLRKPRKTNPVLRSALAIGQGSTFRRRLCRPVSSLCRRPSTEGGPSPAENRYQSHASPGSKLSALSDQLKDHMKTLLEILIFLLDEKAKKVLQRLRDEAIEEKANDELNDSAGKGISDTGRSSAKTLGSRTTLENRFLLYSPTYAIAFTGIACVFFSFLWRENQPPHPTLCLLWLLLPKRGSGMDRERAYGSAQACRHSVSAFRRLDGKAKGRVSRHVAHRLIVSVYDELSQPLPVSNYPNSLIRALRFTSKKANA